MSARRHCSCVLHKTFLFVPKKKQRRSPHHTNSLLLCACVLQSDDYTPAHFDSYDKSIDVGGAQHKVVVTEVECGDPIAHRMWPMFMRSKDAFVLVYDVTRPTTLAFAVERHAELVRERETPHVPAVLVGNKADASASAAARAVSAQEGAETAERLGCPFFEVSARDGTNVHEAVVAAATAALCDNKNSTTSSTKKNNKGKTDNCILM